ncbi:uncharacterized protein LOC125768348 isoform X1 [Anopheles funestus]|uniref:uncharacterized protein LOC125768348 isoform X1 n=2 Tax=Anopheles funestus TaxID=62324 RepID=UPI0020C6B4E7|nr:uncharacterized protein LOC125768348 isoform X1 [Anopheles funestus]
MIVSEMLPELLFSVGGGMQDFSKDDLGLLSSSGVSNEKDSLGHSHIHQDHHTVHQSHLSSTGSGNSVGLVVDEIKLTNIPDLLEPGDANKLEETERDLYPWHTGANIGSRFLRSSDDPLISGGTNDNPHDNELSVSSVSQSMCPSPTTPPPKHRHPSVVLSPDLTETTLSPLPTPPKAGPTATHTKEQSQKRTNSAPRARRKGPLKLRFHHQALPQEYLDHYEATQNNLQKKDLASNQSKSSRQQTKPNHQSVHSSRKVMMERQAALEREERTNESVRSWLQKILELQKEGVSMAPLKDEVVQPSQTSPGSVASESSTSNQNGVQQKRIVSYTDLPYMGEITLENSKPRRGRKPKKADICHLIYKNYGTILPGTPSRELGLEKGMLAKGCSKSVASLLERRLTSSDERKQLFAGDNKPPEPLEQSNSKGRRKEEPLNLCVRDSGGNVLPAGGETFSVSSSEEETDEVFASSCPTPIITPSDICTDQALAANMKLSLPTLQSSFGSTTETPSTAETPPGYMYWSSGTNGLFAHPMSMYNSPPVPAAEGHGKLSEDHLGKDIRTVATSPNASSPPISPTAAKVNQQHPLLVPKHISQLIKNDKQSPPNTGAGQRSPPVQKRKRSAIFIPPVPAENSPNPATEVSICKFKFTGGAKPCLQEKKILSVDSGGNFRYYSGTGDKSMRGYEFFPRESLQQSSINATSTTGAFLNASGERIACDLPPPSLGLSNDLLQIPEFPTSPQPCGSLQGDSSSPVPYSGNTQCRMNTASSVSERRRRKTRRATQRESLEKTFKEKGFLIQTQQLQSAEGATYCKFRQLRKFTRYLFRSWKDYLPGELQQQQEQQAHPLQEGELSNMTLPATVVTSTREVPQEDHIIDEESLLTSSTSSIRMDTVDVCEHRNSPDRAVPSGAYHRMERKDSPSSVTSQHVHSETLVIDTAYLRHGRSSPVINYGPAEDARSVLP